MDKRTALNELFTALQNRGGVLNVRFQGGIWQAQLTLSSEENRAASIVTGSDEDLTNLLNVLINKETESHV